jgi:hypothetical protein
MEDRELKEIVRNSFSFLMNYKHPRTQMVGDLIGYLRNVKGVNTEMNGSLEILAGKLVFKFTYGGYLVEDKVQFDPTTKARYKVVSYKLKDNFDFDKGVDEFFEALKKQEFQTVN